MVTMSAVWDSTTEVVATRRGTLAAIAGPTVFLPGVAYAALPLATTPGSTGFVIASGLGAVAAGVIALWGRLGMRVVGIDPSAARRVATARATARLPAALTVTIVAALVVVAALVPLAFSLGLSVLRASAFSGGGEMPAVGVGTAAFVGLYALVFAVAAIVAGARLILLYPVVIAERRGMGAFARSWALTRGLAWRIVGASALYALVLLVAALAAQFVAGAIAGLLLDDPRLATFLATVARTAVTTIFSVYAAVFTARLYVAVTRVGRGSTADPA